MPPSDYKEKLLRMFLYKISKRQKAACVKLFGNESLHRLSEEQIILLKIFMNMVEDDK